ncbi:MAG: isoleucine--tRNA ligase [Endomicrobiales bacterium]|nr:isoleucine--tRNA ligase [Endomicrobiales bacterium]
MDFSKTVNLPKTDFSMKANLPQREPEYAKKWDESGIYAKMQAKTAGGKKFVLHDGPPYANGHIHLGTALNKVLKDIIVKYKSLAGHHAPYTPGWDCHGLPIEQQCMKEMKVDKHKVEKVRFRKDAAAFARKFIDIQRNEFKRLGVLADWEKPYLTLEEKYEGTIARVFGALARAGYIFRQKKPVYWCPTCETALADAEVEYADHLSHSVYVKFGLEEFKGLKTGTDGASVLIWTTTPWTLPANVALAFQPEAEYVKVQVGQNGRNENLIIAKRLMQSVFERSGIKEHKIIESISGKALEGIKCRNPLVDRVSVGVLADFVSMEDGTGVVHIAPGHGQEDYQVGLKYKLPIVSPVDERGIFTDEAPDFKGHKVFAANQLIIEKLKEKGALLHDDKVSHSYPHCWRCKRAIIFRATPQWFMSVEHNALRRRMLDTIKKVKWVPAYGENRITGMTETRPDWCLSRQRLWGVPIPVFYCAKCNEPLLEERVISHIAGIFDRSGSDAWFEKNEAELLAGLDVKCGCGSADFRKEEDILDVWFDSGVSHEAVLASGNFPELCWPADMYLEGSDQHRGWFQTSLLPAVALREAAPYRAVLTHGFVVDGEGKKMSKSLGNVIAPEQIISQYGADILRLWVAVSDYREDIRISQEIIKGLVDAYRKIRNTFRFILGNLSEFKPSEKVPREEMREVDRHALSSLQDTIRQVTSAYENYEFHKAAVAINGYCTVYLSGFYLDSLKDTLYCDTKGSSARKSAQSALWEIINALTRMLAPVLSFTCEEAWQELRKIDGSLAESVFISDYPKIDEKAVFGKSDAARWGAYFGLREQVLAACEDLRKNKKIGSNLEARVVINETGQLKGVSRDELSMILGTWDVRVNHVKDPGGPDNGMDVSASPSDFAKCERCWRRREDVTNNNKHGAHLCPRCVEALG